LVINTTPIDGLLARARWTTSMPVGPIPRSMSAMTSDADVDLTAVIADSASPVCVTTHPSASRISAMMLQIRGSSSTTTAKP
jgi:hypothetical protein